MNKLHSISEPNGQSQWGAKVFAVLLAVILVLLGIGPVLAVDEKPKSEEEIEFSGLLVNQTVTPAGNRFYEEFSSKWISPQVDIDFNVVIRERPDPQWGTLIWVTVNEERVFAKIFSRRGSLDEGVREALGRVYRHVITMKLKTYDPDSDLDANGY